MKHTIKTWAASAALAVLAVGPVAAQNADTRVLDRIGERLELSEAQLTQIRSGLEAEQGRTDLWKVAAQLQQTLNADQKEKLIEEGRVRGAYTRGFRAGQTVAARGVRGAQGRAGRAARTGNGRNEAAGRGGRATQGRGAQNSAGVRGARGPFMDRVLEDLSDEQKEAFAKLRKEHGEAVRALATAQEGDEVDRQAIRARSQELRTKLREQAKEILTDEQRERLESLEGRRGARGRTTLRGSRGPVGGGRGMAGSRTSARPAQRAQTGQALAGRAQARSGAGMAEALNLTDAQRETMQIHAALAGAVAGPQMAQRAQMARRPRAPRSR